MVFEQFYLLQSEPSLSVAPMWKVKLKYRVKKWEIQKSCGFKYKPVKYRRLTGHRQPMTLIKIQSIES